MKRLDRYTFKIESKDKQRANKENWGKTRSQKETVYISILSELAAAAYLKIKRETSKHEADLIDNDGIRYQVKAVQEGWCKTHHWLEDKTDNFDRYILVVIDELEKIAKIESDSLRKFLNANRKTFHNLPAINRK